MQSFKWSNSRYLKLKFVWIPIAFKQNMGLNSISNDAIHIRTLWFIFNFLTWLCSLSNSTTNDRFQIQFLDAVIQVEQLKTSQVKVSVDLCCFLTESEIWTRNWIQFQHAKSTFKWCDYIKFLTQLFKSSNSYSNYVIQITFFCKFASWATEFQIVWLAFSVIIRLFTLSNSRRLQLRCLWIFIAPKLNPNYQF